MVNTSSTYLITRMRGIKFWTTDFISLYSSILYKFYLQKSLEVNPIWIDTPLPPHRFNILDLWLRHVFRRGNLLQPLYRRGQLPAGPTCGRRAHGTHVCVLSIPTVFCYHCDYYSQWGYGRKVSYLSLVLPAMPSAWCEFTSPKGSRFRGNARRKCSLQPFSKYQKIKNFKAENCYSFLFCLMKWVKTKQVEKGTILLIVRCLPVLKYSQMIYDFNSHKFVVRNNFVGN